ncbi:hypothetical protein ACQ4N7_26745 [Nodosilinea sp. AN01ver1]|uniref:hypothetical protein n=1 Tax=Nodosilinea sp. AN01ver1 TaxID=3423362 RepID=UPI003D31F968
MLWRMLQTVPHFTPELRQQALEGLRWSLEDLQVAHKIAIQQSALHAETQRLAAIAACKPLPTASKGRSNGPKI